MASIKMTGNEQASLVVSKQARNLRKAKIVIWREFASQKAHIINRTKKGLDVNLKPFTAYSSSYKKQKLKKKYKKYSGHPNLIANFRMLASIVRAKISNGMKLYFNDQLQKLKAERHNSGLAGMTERYFMGADKKQEKAFVKKVNKKIIIG